MDHDFRAAEEVVAAFCRGYATLLGVCAAMFALAWLLSGLMGWFTLWITAMALVFRGMAWLWKPSGERDVV